MKVLQAVQQQAAVTQDPMRTKQAKGTAKRSLDVTRGPLMALEPSSANNASN